MFQHILVPLDGSTFAEAALDPALALAKAFQSRLTLVRIVPHPQIVLSEYTYEVADLFMELRTAAVKDAEEYLKAQQGSLSQQGYEVRYQVIEGDNVAEWLLDVAESGDVDTLIMSTHGRSGLQRWVFGSVAEKVIRQARIPVLLVRPTAAAETTLVETPAVSAETA